jgi:hypothetical protein
MVDFLAAFFPASLFLPVNWTAFPDSEEKARSSVRPRPSFGLRFRFAPCAGRPV